VLGDARIYHAIHTRTLLAFDYGGHPRIVAPYCYGLTAANIETLRAIQIGGTSSSGGFGFGKLWTISKISNLRTTAEPFLPTDPSYNPNDSAMTRILCRI
jgi:hypothetical protein